MALQWVLRDGRVTSARIGARDPAQLDDSLAALGDPPLAADELAEIEKALAGA